MNELASILFWAILAGIVLWRLYSVLGQRTGHFNDLPPTQDIPEEEPHVVRAASETPPEAHLSNAEAEMIKTLKVLDPGFDIHDFREGAAYAFEMILHAVAKGDLETLKNLLSTELYAEFADDIKRRQEQGEVLEVTLVRLDPVEFLHIETKGSVAHITLRIVSEQVHVVKDQKGQIIEGGQQQSVQVEDIWTFERDTRSSDPNWRLIKAES